jgi:hypothetical protein
MKTIFSPDLLPLNSIFMTCSSHEGRCAGVISRMGDWRPSVSIVFHYDDINPIREVHHEQMMSKLQESGCAPVALPVTEVSAVRSLCENMSRLRQILFTYPGCPVVFDISVLTKRHLLMMLRWLDDEQCWDRLWIVYSEPEDYDVSKYIPLSFGLSTLQQIPGFAACPDLSRPVHLVLFLGYEGDRALAVYEHIQPMQTTLAVPFPPYKASWEGRTERFNADLIGVVGSSCAVPVDAIDPDAVHFSLQRMLGNESGRSQSARVISPLGTKPQTVGIYSYVRACVDPPSIVYASPLRHNHAFFSHGVGNTWVLKQGSSA